ncbi:ATP-binding cassette domain-containing protein [Nocardiopsis sp. NPDC058631]|uniref:ATP-binding cassette domain-containing protein n=1 Tax=Nocardiopsis sp. NPDC058631 TaxID=3346566 RepID=UPI003648AE31
MNTGLPAISVHGLVKRYGRTTALDGVDLSVASGSVVGVLGPNGSGKTTLVRVLATLMRYDEGDVRVAGYDVAKQAQQVRSRIGLVGQYAALDERLTARENLMMFARLYRLNRAEARAGTEELLRRFDLEYAADRVVKTYSGGMRRRLDLAASLLVSPEVLFLDEPTTGLDPKSRREIWGMVRTLAVEGTTILMTTQYLDEADQLADQIVVLDSGTVIAEGTPGELKDWAGGERLEVVVPEFEDLHDTASAIGGVSNGTVIVKEDERKITIPVRNGIAALASVVRELDSRSVAADDIVLRRPTLDDAFSELTESRRRLEDKKGSADKQAIRDTFNFRTGNRGA